jgi:ABC-type transport system involved in multi-copper enzyme maturation permease subunit
VLGGGEASLAIAAIALRRATRGRMLPVIGGLSLVPLVLSLQLKGADTAPDKAWEGLVGTWSYLVAILAPILLGSAIGEEIEERTATYLWSRPLPRWTIIVGKLVALVPVLWLLMLISLLLPGLIFYKEQLFDHFGEVLAALLLGTTAVAAMTAGLTALWPKFGHYLTLGYLVAIDRTLGWSEKFVGKITMSFHTLNLAGVHDAHESTLEAVIGLLVLTAIWISIAVWRIRRME